MPRRRTDRIAELRRQIAEAPDVRTRVEVQLKLVDELAASDPVAAEAEARRAVAEARAAELADLLAMGLTVIAFREMELGRLEGSAALCREALAIARPVGARKAEAAAENLLGALCEQHTDLPGATAHYEACLRISREIGYEGGMSTALSNLAVICYPTGQYERCTEYLKQAQDLEEKRGDLGAAAQSLGMLAACHEELGNWEEALECAYRALAIADEQGFGIIAADVLSTLAFMSQKRGHLDRALELHRRSLELTVAYGRADSEALGCTLLAMALLDRSDLAAAETMLDQAQRIAQDLGDREELIRVDHLRAELRLAQGRPAEALTLAEQARDRARALNLSLGYGMSQRALGLIHAALGAPGAARAAFADGIQAMTGLLAGGSGPGSNYWLADSRLAFARFLADQGEVEAARREAEAAATAFRSLGILPGIEQANRILHELTAAADLPMSLLSGLSSIVSQSAPLSEVALAFLGQLTSGLRFGTGVLHFYARRPFVIGNLQLTDILARPPVRELVVRPNSVELPIQLRRDCIGVLYLGDPVATGPRVDPVFWEVVGHLLTTLAEKVRARTTLTGGVPADERLGLRVGDTAGVPLRFGTMVAQSPAFSKLLDMMERAAPTPACVLIRGESGTGKELIARAIHDSSPRARARFAAINCAALPEHLIEAELFGIEAGVATGVRARPGKLAQADGGTVFLDEIGDMPPAVQAKLLRVLQEHVIEPVGGRPRPIDLRVLAATHRDLESGIKDGWFREDLYHRLNVITLAIPPLRDRREEIPLLVEHFIRRFSEEFLRPVNALTREALTALLDYPWPGNVRELEHAIESAVILARDGTIGVNDLPTAIRVRPRAASPDLAARPSARRRITPSVERTLVIEALRRYDWDVPRAAVELKLSKSHLYRLVKKLGIDLKART